MKSHIFKKKDDNKSWRKQDSMLQLERNSVNYLIDVMW